MAGWRGKCGLIPLRRDKNQDGFKKPFFIYIVVVCVFVTRLGCKRERKRRFFRVGSEMLRIQF